MAELDSDLVVTSVKLPRGMRDSLDAYAKENGYASTSEVIRMALRDRLYANLREMRGALKGKVKTKESVYEMRRRLWREALEKTGGDARKASELLDAEADDAVKKLGL